ncbi:MAG TPA: C39 family peptidase [Candidatus Acidoferrales bacterium]|nr:C39 family peptidase [Candidatus Acidoferrales bacterium]
MKYRSSLPFVSALILFGCATPHSLPNAPLANASAIAQAAGTTLDVPPRLQWNANFGYCGETSMISAGLYYGQYVSQYTARDIASDGTPQNQQNSQLLLGGNDMHAANLMHLSAVRWNTGAQRNTAEFLRWVRAKIERGYPVAIGVYTNMRRFNEKLPGQHTYDHIVPVTGVTADSLTFSDNGLWNPGKPPFSFTYSFATFPKTRRQANEANGPIYSLANYGSNYAVAIRGVADPDGETLPVRLTTSVKWERPPMRNGSTVRPRAMPLTLTIVVSNLKPGVAYRLYRYDRLARIPNRRFNAMAANASESWAIDISSGSSYTRTEAIMSDEVAAYRAVPVSGA